MFPEAAWNISVSVFSNRLGIWMGKGGFMYFVSLNVLQQKRKKKKAVRGGV